MEFSYFLSAYMPDGAYGGKRLFADMVEQAVTADRLGYRGVSIPEHHLINITMIPEPKVLRPDQRWLKRHHEKYANQLPGVCPAAGHDCSRPCHSAPVVGGSSILVKSWSVVRA